MRICTRAPALVIVMIELAGGLITTTPSEGGCQRTGFSEDEPLALTKGACLILTVA